jgi:hypothetical protein
MFVELFDESLFDVFPEFEVFVELFEASWFDVLPVSDVLVELFELSVVLVEVVVVVEPGSAACASALVDRTAASAKAEAEARNFVVI